MPSSSLFGRQVIQSAMLLCRRPPQQLDKIQTQALLVLVGAAGQLVGHPHTLCLTVWPRSPGSTSVGRGGRQQSPAERALPSIRSAAAGCVPQVRVHLTRRNATSSLGRENGARNCAKAALVACVSLCCSECAKALAIPVSARSTMAAWIIRPLLPLRVPSSTTTTTTTINFFQPVRLTVTLTIPPQRRALEYSTMAMTATINAMLRPGTRLCVILVLASAAAVLEATDGAALAIWLQFGKVCC